MNNSPRSGSLFHYTSCFCSLKSILKNGFYPRYCLEETSLFFHSPKNVAFPMICFCDIPISRSGVHTEQYGRYGISVKKEWAIRNKANPVIYLSPQSALLNDLRHLLNQDQENKNLNVSIATYGLIAYCKPIDSPQADGTLKEFHQECEWRYVPEIDRDHIDAFLREEAFTNTEEKEIKQNALAKHYQVGIQASDITSIIVNSDHEVDEALNFIDKLEHYSDKERNLLKTRLTSFESINREY